MTPPPAEPLAARIFLGPALRAQPDRRLVTLVREGYEAAFEEIVRRYRKPLDRFAAAIVGGRSEDVTQDAFSKALLALRGSEKEIELRPWLYRIVRNTALNDLRDHPPAAAELSETISGGVSAAVEAERREEIAELIERLRALPEPQRAAIVMRELEGLSHEEIAAALGVSGGAARQAIYRARAALRDGLGLLIPLPLLRILFDHGAEAVGAGAGGAVAAGAATGGGGAGATLGGLGAGGALKVGVATALLAGSVGAGVAVQQERGGGQDPPAAAAAQLPGKTEGGSLSDSQSSSGRSGPGRSDDSGDRGSGGPGPGSDDNTPRGSSGHNDSSGHGGRGGHVEPEGISGGDHSGEGTSGGSQSGRHGSGSDSSGSGDDPPSAVEAPPAAPEPPPEDHSGSDSDSGSGSGGSSNSGRD